MAEGNVVCQVHEKQQANKYKVRGRGYIDREVHATMAEPPKTNYRPLPVFLICMRYMAAAAVVAGPC